MEFQWLIVSFVVLMIFVAGLIILILRWILFSSTESSVKRLDEEISKATAKQVELSKKLKSADEELNKRRQEAHELSEKMRLEAEAGSKGERDKIIETARTEAEQIIAKAQNAKEQMVKELEKEMDLKGVEFGMVLLNKILSQKAQTALEDVLVDDFMTKLQDTDMNKIGPEVKAVEVITASPIKDDVKKRLSDLIKKKTNREFAITTNSNPDIAGGVVLKFGSLALDGSVKNLLREEAVKLKTLVENKKY